MPKSVTKVTKDGVTFIDSVDRVNYTVTELTRAALRDVAKLVKRRTRSMIKRRTGRLSKNLQHWIRKKETDLIIGFKPGGWYGIFQELGTEKQPKIGALYHGVADNINQIRDIEAQYLSAIEDEQKALALINEEEELNDD